MSLHLTGQYLSAQHIEARKGKDGTEWPERWNLQLMVTEDLENGTQRVDVIHLATTDPDQVKAFSAHAGKTISLAVRAYASGRAVAFAIQPDARPIPALSQQTKSAA